MLQFQPSFRTSRTDPAAPHGWSLAPPASRCWASQQQARSLVYHHVFCIWSKNSESESDWELNAMRSQTRSGSSRPMARSDSSTQSGAGCSASAATVGGGPASMWNLLAMYVCRARCRGDGEQKAGVSEAAGCTSRHH